MTEVVQFFSMNKDITGLLRQKLIKYGKYLVNMGLDNLEKECIDKKIVLLINIDRYHIM